MITCKYLITDLGKNELLDFFFSAFLCELILGYFIFVFWDRISAKMMLPYSIVICIVLLSLAVYLNIGYGWIRVITFGIFALFLIWISIFLEYHGVVFSKGPLKIAGDASYTIYLSHTILLDLFYASGLREYFVTTHTPLLGFTLTLIVITAFSVLFYKYIELPLYKQVKTICLIK